MLRKIYRRFFRPDPLQEHIKRGLVVGKNFKMLHGVIIDYSSSTRLTRTAHDSIGLWSGTFNSNTALTPDGTYLIVFRVFDDEGIRVLVPVTITIQNTSEKVDWPIVWQ